MAKIVGIDLGTTFSAIAHVNANEIPELIPNEDRDRLTPSLIFYDEGAFIVGKYAKQNALAEPKNAVEFIKREMGKPSTEFSREFGGEQYAPEALSAEILKTLKRDAETELGEQVTDAVITVPAYFNDSERQATIRAGKLAGLNVQRIINEPTAAALAYGKHLSGDTSKVLVFDLGGGTFDVTALQVEGQEMTILATDGDHRLGGKDWDDKIILHIAERFKREHGEEPLKDLAAYLDIQARAVDAKIQLSTLNRATIITNYAHKSDRLQLTRQEFEDMTVDLVERCRSLVDVVLDEITLTPDHIDKVLLVGGSTRMPMIQNMLTEHFGKPPDTSVNPDEAVAVGAAIMGTLIQSEAMEPRRFLGAAPEQHSGIARISDVCSHSLGMLVLDKKTSALRNSTIIAKNTNIPCDVSRDDYRTASANQTEFDVIVLQGPEDLEPRECPVRDAYEVFDIPPRPAGKTRIKITYKYNTNGVIEVEAEDVRAGKILPMRKKEGEIDWDALIAGTEVSEPMDIALAIDCSGSMGGGKLEDAKKAAIRFLRTIDPSFRVGLISFETTAQLEMRLTKDFDRLSQKIKTFRSGGGTNIREAIAIARDQVLASGDSIKVLILLTDGHASVRTEAVLAKQQGIRIIAIGVGDGVNSDSLKQIASTPDDYYFVEESVQLESAFTTIASRLVTESS